MSHRLISIDDGDQNQPSHWVRMEANATVAQCREKLNAGGGLLIPVAICPEGRRLPDAHIPLSFKILVDALGATTSIIPILEHAGPCAGTWSSERPLGASVVPDVPTKRTPRAATEADWLRIKDAAASALTAIPKSMPVLLSADDDGLLMAAVSPRTNPDPTDAERINLLVEFVTPLQRLRPDLGVLVCIDELAPRGIDLAFGKEQIAALENAGVQWTVWTAGTRALSSLKRRPREQTQTHVWTSPARLLAERCPRVDGDRRWLEMPPGANAFTADEARALATFDAFVVDESATDREDSAE